MAYPTLIPTNVANGAQNPPETLAHNCFFMLPTHCHHANSLYWHSEIASNGIHCSAPLRIQYKGQTMEARLSAVLQLYSNKCV